MSAQVDRVVSIFKTLAQIPGLSSARISNNGTVVGSIWTQRNLERNKITKIATTQNINENLEVISETSFGIDVSNEVMSVVSPQETLRAIIKEQIEAKDTKKQYLEIWKYRHMERCIELPALDIHGDVYADSEFGILNWDKDEKRIIYIAERKLPKSEPFYKRHPSTSKASNSKDEEVTKGNEYVYKQEWGEQLVGKHLSSIVVCEIETETFSVVDWLPESWCPGQILWSPDASSIVGVAWETEPRRLGLIFCTNRPGFIFQTTLDGTVTKISKEGNSVRSPRFNQNGDCLIWLQRKIGGPHHSCHQIVKTSWPLESNPKIETVVDIVDIEIDIQDGKKFTGVYAQGFPKRCFALDSKRLIFSTPQKTEVRSYSVDVETGIITDISSTSFPCSTSIIDVHNDYILASRSSMKQPSQLIIAKLPAAGKESSIEWKLISKESVPVPSAISSATLRYMDLTHETSNEPVKDFTALFMGGPQTEGKAQPLIVQPHGGPHSSFANTYSIETALYIMLGFSMVQINYRGSTGAGQKSLEYLSSRVGEADVKDCVLTTDKAIENFSIDKDKCVLLGRSHGGFLVTHLSGQYPDKYSAVVAGNPVTDVASMINATDIPDWCSYEAGTEFNEVGPVSKELLVAMRNASPLAYAHNVKAPTLMLLGSKDKRVPYFQGLEFYQKIKANGCKTKALVYEDNHALSLGAFEIDHEINGALWLLEHTQ